MIMCPSTDFSESTHVLAIRREDGELRFFSELLPIPREAVETMSVEDLRDRVRLTGPCVMSRCFNWNGSCTLGPLLVSRTASQKVPCPIRGQCRWLIENGESVCGQCTEVMRMKEFEHAII
jgi:hypothetical protein